jgi:hypothetical protein
MCVDGDSSKTGQECRIILVRVRKLFVATEDAIYKLTNEILNASNNKRVAGSIFCDLEKAFESVNHDILISKLQYYGIRCKAKSLLESYLQNRYQRFHITNTYHNSNSVSK